jgi:oligosaccharide repeat unit polymerase
MYALVVICFLVVVWSLWRRVNAALYNDELSPFSLLFYFWIGPFILSLSKLSRLQTGMDPYAVGIISVSTLLLAATCLAPAMAGMRPDFLQFISARIRPVKVQPVGVLAFFALTLVTFYFAEFHGRELPLLAYILGDADDSNLHTSGKESRLQIIAFGIHSASILMFYMALNERRRWLRLFYTALSLTVVVLGLAKASKSDIFIPVLAYGGLVYYHYRIKNKAFPRLLLVVAALAVLMIVSITSVRLQGVGLTEGYSGLIEFRHTDSVGPVAAEFISIIYGYTALGFQNFSNYVATHPAEFRLGTSLFRPVLSALMMGDEADIMGVPVDQWNVVSDAANTGTFLTPLYIEGGVIFCLIGALLYGLLVNFVYLSFRSKGSIAWLFAYISLLFPWTWLFFTNAFSVLSIYVNLFYIVALTAMFMDKPSGPLVSARLRTIPD